MKEERGEAGWAEKKVNKKEKEEKNVLLHQTATVQTNLNRTEFKFKRTIQRNKCNSKSATTTYPIFLFINLSIIFLIFS